MMYISEEVFVRIKYILTKILCIHSCKLKYLEYITLLIFEMFLLDVESCFGQSLDRLLRLNEPPWTVQEGWKLSVPLKGQAK